MSFQSDSFRNIPLYAAKAINGQCARARRGVCIDIFHYHPWANFIYIDWVWSEEEADMFLGTGQYPQAITTWWSRSSVPGETKCLLLRLYTGEQRERGVRGNTLVRPHHLEDGGLPCLHMIDDQARQSSNGSYEQGDGPQSYFLVPSEFVNQSKLVQHSQSVSNNKSSSLRIYLARKEVFHSKSKVKTPQSYLRPVEIEDYLLHPAADFKCPEPDLASSLAQFYLAQAEDTTDRTLAWTPDHVELKFSTSYLCTTVLEVLQAQGDFQMQFPGTLEDTAEEQPPPARAAGTSKQGVAETGDVKDGDEEDYMGWARRAGPRLFSG